jgi:hypothetical protein
MDARLLFPKLKPFYDWVEPLTWPLIRLTVGLMIIPHGWPKLMMGVGATAQMALVKRGIWPSFSSSWKPSAGCASPWDSSRAFSPRPSPSKWR